MLTYRYIQPCRHWTPHYVSRVLPGIIGLKYNQCPSGASLASDSMIGYYWLPLHLHE